MDGSNAVSSAQRSDSSSSASPSAGPFAYQTRLLERASSRGSTGTLSRSGSQDAKRILASPTGSSATRRWTPAHRVGGSLDVARGKWEALSSTSTEDTGSSTDNVLQPSTSLSSVSPNRSTRYTSLLSSAHRRTEADTVPEPNYSTPIVLKRRTLPDPIIASPLSPNTTGVTVENPDSPTGTFSTSTTARIHLPVSTPLQSSLLKQLGSTSSASKPQRGIDSDYTTSYGTSRANAVESINPVSTGSSTASEVGSVSSTTSRTSFAFSDTPSRPSTSIHRRPMSLYNGSYPITPTSSDKPAHPTRTLARSSSASPTKQLVSPSPASSVMSPKPYMSSYMQKKAAKYGDTLVAGRRLGRHLPRIASGDGPEEPSTEMQKDKEPPPRTTELVNDRRHRRGEMERHLQDTQVPQSPQQTKHAAIAGAGILSGDGVIGIPGRIRLSRDKAAPTSPTSPLPSSRLTHGLWADVQRNLIQAYEYLCHVGEAQQWIEGCLGEELDFGVVEMEEGLRNGVVLAKLVRVFQGEAAVRKIYEAPKLDFRHSDNINHFFNFVRYVGLPESFIFELTDLYEKKNFPKVVYCIHALSHLLARRGIAERIGNLLGQLQFSDDQLQKTQRGLKESGVTMPNFGNVGRELAKEINEEPEEEETEEDRHDRLLLENEGSIVACQALARAFLVRKDQATQRVRIRLAERYVPKVQAHARAALTRTRLGCGRRERENLGPWVVFMQAQARGDLLRSQWRLKLEMIKASTYIATQIQAQVRGVLQRRKYRKFKAAIRSAKISIVQLQSLARAKIAQKYHQEVAKTFDRPIVMGSVVAFQAHARSALLRIRMRKLLLLLRYAAGSTASLQAQARGVILRRRVRIQLATLEDQTDIVVRIQAAVRTYLARKRLLVLIRGLRKATPAVLTLQARARANMVRLRHSAMQKALSEVKIVTSIGDLQSLARAALTRNRHRQQAKRLEFAEPDVVGFQATGRGALVRSEYHAWRDFLHRSHAHAAILQAMLRGVMQRRKFRAKMQYYRSNLDKIVQIQSLYRAKETREQYRQLTLGTNVSVGTIKNFVHLLDDSEADFQEEIKVERLRTEAVQRIRENQALESHVNDLDVKIALVVQNVKTFEEVLKVRKHGGDSAAVHAARASVLAAHGDPFAGPSTLDHAAKRKLELYQQLFYVLQTRGDYLTQLLAQAATGKDWEKNRRLIERVVLTLFGYGHDRREDYLLLKFFQTAIHDEILTATSVQAITRGHPSFINIVVQYVRTKQTAYVRETLQTVIREVLDSDELDLEADPSVIYRTRIDVEETRSGVASPKPRDLPFHQAAKDPDTRAEYIRHLQLLVGLTRAFLTAIVQSTAHMPFAVRFLARETLAALRLKFPDIPNAVYAACIARLVFYRFINPAIITPEMFDIVSHTIDIAARKNLSQISRVLTQITTGTLFGEDNPCYVPINDFVDEAIQELSTWMIAIADVQDAETQYNAHEFLDATVQPKAIHITPNEVYTMHTVLSQHLDAVAPARDDTLRVILTELNGVPNIGNDELNDARDSAIELQLTNRFAHVRDPRADEKALWVQAKRAVLAILRVQPAQDLVESLMQPVTDEHEIIWAQIIEETQRELTKLQRRMPSTTGADSAYRLEDIQSMTFREVKAHAIYFLLELEKQGKISRMDGYQGILNAIAGDVRSKNRRRLQRQHEKESLEEALRDLADRRKHFEEQINSYHDYVETAMSTMQRGKGKKRFTMPFTKQYFHLRDLQKAGKSPQFGSFKYSAQHFYDKGILLSIDQFSPRQFDKMDIVLSSNSVGIFTVEILNNALGITNRVAVGDVKMEDLLQAQFENRASLSLFNGLAKFNLNLLLWQINKKFYV